MRFERLQGTDLQFPARARARLLSIAFRCEERGSGRSAGFAAPRSFGDHEYRGDGSPFSVGDFRPEKQPLLEPLLPSTPATAEAPAPKCSSPSHSRQRAPQFLRAESPEKNA